MENKTAILEKIQGYYLKGLNYKEIGKLLDTSPRTVQRYIKESGCKQTEAPKSLEQTAIELHRQGFSYSQIAKRLKRSKTTIYIWNKKERERGKDVAQSGQFYSFLAPKP